MGRLLLATAAASIGLALTSCASDRPEVVSLTPVGETGRQIALENQCGTCHGTDGQGAAGPAFTGQYGTTVQLEDGRTVTYDDGYITRAVRDPGAEVREGQGGVEMPAYPDTELSDEDLAAIIAFIRELATA